VNSDRILSSFEKIRENLVYSFEDPVLRCLLLGKISDFKFHCFFPKENFGKTCGKKQLFFFW